MTTSTDFDRHLTDWLEATGSPHLPDYVDELLDRTKGTRQRPAWASLERWLPMQVALPRPVALVPRAAWLLVHAAPREGWGIVLTEAAAQGTPAIAFDVPGVRDAVVSGETGVLVDDDDAFTKNWIELALDEPARTAMSERARSFAATFTWQRSVYELLAAAHAAGAS